MKRHIRMHAVLSAALVLGTSSARAVDDVPVRAMTDELARSMAQLRLDQMERPYFVAYRMDDMEVATISASLGSLTRVEPARSRWVNVELRVGSYDLDNTNYVSAASFPGGANGAWGPLDDDYREIRRVFWRATDEQYKSALESLAAKRAALQARKRSVEEPDFTREVPHVEAGKVERTDATIADLQTLARELSAVFSGLPSIQRSSVRIDTRDVRTRYVNSEGSSFTRSAPFIKLSIQAEARAEDGQPVSDSIDVYARSVSELPARDSLIAEARGMARRIVQLRAAPLIERYNGPVLFEGVAAGEIFAQQFAGALSSARQPVGDDPRFEAFYAQAAAQLGGGSWIDKVGARVLPEFLTVTDSPLDRVQGTGALLGGQRVDDDGVACRETRLVERGVLKRLLTTRVPVRNLAASSGSRRGGGAAPSNLIVTSQRAVPNAELRRDLLSRARARGLDYAIIVRRVGGGGATASLLRLAARMAAQSSEGSNAMAEVVRLHADGREELLRGVELAELPPAAFRDIVAVGDTATVYTGEFVNLLQSMFTQTAPAGGIMPVISCVVPALLFDEVSLVKTPGPFPVPFVAAPPLAAQ